MVPDFSLPGPFRRQIDETSQSLAAEFPGRSEQGFFLSDQEIYPPEQGICTVDRHRIKSHGYAAASRIAGGVTAKDR